MTYSLLTSCLVALLGCDPGNKSVTATATVAAGEEGGSGSESAEETGQAFSTTGDLVCEDLLGPDDLGPGAVFRIRNDSDLPIWVHTVGECFGDPAFRLLDAAGTTVEHVRSCLDELCDTAIGSTDCILGCADCGVANAIRLAPGAEGELTWSGRRLDIVDLPADCTASDECPTTCAQQTRAPDGVYTVELDVYTSCEGDCECLDGDEVEGFCRLFTDANPTSTPDVRSVTFDYPAQTDIELVFDF